MVPWKSDVSLPRIKARRYMLLLLLLLVVVSLVATAERVQPSYSHHIWASGSGKGFTRPAAYGEVKITREISTAQCREGGVLVVTSKLPCFRPKTAVLKRGLP